MLVLSYDGGGGLEWDYLDEFSIFTPGVFFEHF
jgi:hypothetical protein